MRYRNIYIDLFPERVDSILCKCESELIYKLH